jgi:hypothetical protein
MPTEDGGPAFVRAPFEMRRVSLTRTALPALTNALSDPDASVRTNAADAIQAISPRVRTVASVQ